MLFSLTDTEAITNTDEGALRFAVEFAQADLVQLPPDAYLAMLRSLRAFIYRNASHPFPIHDPEIELLQSRTLEILNGMANQQKIAVAGDMVLSIWLIAREGEGVRLQVLGSPLDLMLYRLAHVIASTGVDRLMRCESQKRGTVCGRLFLKVTVKRFCSTTCQSRALMQQRRADAQKEEERERMYAKAKRTRRR